jgi:hypothetical protein
MMLAARAIRCMIYLAILREGLLPFKDYRLIVTCTHTAIETLSNIYEDMIDDHLLDIDHNVIKYANSPLNLQNAVSCNNMDDTFSLKHCRPKH